MCVKTLCTPYLPIRFPGPHIQRRFLSHPVRSDHPRRSDRIPGDGFELDSDCQDPIGSDGCMSIARNSIKVLFSSKSSFKQY